jgi:histidine triad (HIT) family protein
MHAQAYDDQNIFAKIIRGEAPCFKVHEDENTIVFMDIMPRSRGHTLIVPKAASRNLLDAQPSTLAAVIDMAQRVALAVKKAFQPDGVMLVQFSESAAGQTVFHLHFHIVPAYAGTALKPEGTKGDMASIEEDAGLLKKALAEV